jgi:hypothetical protein
LTDSKVFRRPPIFSEAGVKKLDVRYVVESRPAVQRELSFDLIVYMCWKVAIEGI